MDTPGDQHRSGVKPPRLRAIIAMLVAGPLLVLTTWQLASADVTIGQRLNPKNYSCGANERVTGELVFYGPVPTKQRALIYRNCKSTAVHRKADVIADWDGKCMKVPAGKAVVLHAEQAIPSRDVYNGAKAC